jgi:hypothetical protein
VNRGAGERALTGDEITRKYRDNAAMALSSRRIEEVRDAILGIEHLSAREFMAALTSRG